MTRRTLAARGETLRLIRAGAVRSVSRWLARSCCQDRTLKLATTTFDDWLATHHRDISAGDLPPAWPRLHGAMPHVSLLATQASSWDD